MNSYCYEFKQPSAWMIDSKKTVTEKSLTYSDLKLLEQIHPISNFKVEFEFFVEKQYRLQNPHSWETFWLFWSYWPTADGFKETNYIAFKTNGLEIGRAFKSHDQKFIWTTDLPKIEIGKWSKIVFSKKNQLYLIEVNGQSLTVGPFADLYQITGRIGLYTEDARVQVRNLRYTFE